MTIILGWLSLLQTSPLGTIELLKSFEIMTKSGESLLQLIDDLLDMSSIIQGKIRIQSQNIVLATVLEECVGALQSTSLSKGVDITFQSLDPWEYPRLWRTGPGAVDCTNVSKLTGRTN